MYIFIYKTYILIPSKSTKILTNESHKCVHTIFCQQTYMPANCTPYKSVMHMCNTYVRHR